MINIYPIGSGRREPGLSGSEKGETGRSMGFRWFFPLAHEKKYINKFRGGVRSTNDEDDDYDISGFRTIRARGYSGCLGLARTKNTSSILSRGYSWMIPVKKNPFSVNATQHNICIKKKTQHNIQNIHQIF